MCGSNQAKMEPYIGWVMSCVYFHIVFPIYSAFPYIPSFDNSDIPICNHDDQPSVISSRILLDPSSICPSHLLSAMLSHGDILLVSSFLTAPVTNGHQHARRADSWPYVIEHVHEMVRDRYGNRQMRAEVNYENNTYDINELKKYVNVRRSETI